MVLSRLVAFGVFVAAIVSLVALWGVFFTMWIQGETSIVVYANRFGEFGLELVGLTLAVIFLPVLLYEANEALFEGR